MKTWKTLSKAILPVLAMLVLAPSAYAADYSFETTAPQDYYKSTSYEDVYGSQYKQVCLLSVRMRHLSV